jgi:hypothetical protein
VLIGATCTCPGSHLYVPVVIEHSRHRVYIAGINNSCIPQKQPPARSAISVLSVAFLPSTFASS